MSRIVKPGKVVPMEMELANHDSTDDDLDDDLKLPVFTSASRRGLPPAVVEDRSKLASLVGGAMQRSFRLREEPPRLTADQRNTFRFTQSAAVSTLIDGDGKLHPLANVVVSSLQALVAVLKLVFRPKNALCV